MKGKFGIRTTLSVINEPRFKGKTFTQPSLTVPDRVFSVSKILEMHANGIPVSAQADMGQFFGKDLEIPDLDTLDLVDRLNFLRDQRKRVDELTVQVTKEAAAARDAQQRLNAEKQKKLLEELKEQLSPDKVETT